MRTFSARETEWLLELDGIELAGFWQRAIAFLIDWIIGWSLFVAFVAVVGFSIYGIQRHDGKYPPMFRVCTRTAQILGSVRQIAQIVLRNLYGPWPLFSATRSIRSWGFVNASS